MNLNLLFYLEFAWIMSLKLSSTDTSEQTCKCQVSLIDTDTYDYI